MASAAPSFPARLNGESRPEFLRDELLHEIAEETARRRPAHCAVRDATRQWSYRELIGRSTALAHHFRNAGLGRGDRVVVWLARGLDMYAVMLGIFQAGGIYVPLDPGTPPDRAGVVVRDSAAKLVVTDRAHAEAAALFPAPRFFIDDAGRPPAPPPARALTRADTGLTPADGAYIIYTSGSTGRPKGVLIAHRAICHFVRAEGAVLGLQPSDVVYQGSSLAFDMSLEEIWPAWAAGATLLAGTGNRAHAGADLAPWLAREGVTALTCVPTLLAMQEQPIPTLRLLNLGGEACPPELVRRWARPGLRILNTYGPTEATITATYAELAPDRPVTIGRPLPNYIACILDERLEPVGPGAEGELCLGGPGLALGYVDRDDLTARSFVRDPTASATATDARLYRTGDRARWRENGELEFLGRLDDQVKIRGHRVELGEIEAALLATGVVRHAAVVLQRAAQGDDVLVACVVPVGGPLDEAALRARLAQSLPAYMVPAVYRPLPFLPTLPSGKVDRKRLPALPHAAAAARVVVAPVTGPEKAIHAAFAGLFAPAAVSIDDDFFLDLGGHSLRAAALVSALRRAAEWRHVSMADVYAEPTVRRLAARLVANRPPPASAAREPEKIPPATGRFLLCGAAQAAGLVLVYGLFSLQWLIPYLTYAWLYNQEELERPAAIAVSLGLFIVVIPCLLAFGIAAKWLILGRLRPGRYPLWGFTYFRWWLVDRLLDTAPVHYLGGTPLLAVYHRLLGARIGRGVFLGSDAIDAPDCVEIGDDTSFGHGAMLSCCRVDRGWLHVGTIRIGRGCDLGISATVGANTVLGDGAELADLSMLPPGGVIPAGERWSGSPARPQGAAPAGQPARAKDATRWAFGGLYAGLLLIFPLFAILPVFPGMILMTELDQNTDAYTFILLSPLLAAGFVLTMGLQIVALKWLLVGRVQPATLPVYGFGYLRHWLVDQLMQLSLDIVNPLYATLYLNPWYRLLGVRLGPRAEVSTASSIGHDLLEVGAESFIADAVSLGAPRIHRGVFTLARTSVGRRAFVGNSAVLPPGTALADGVLVGVLSRPPETPAAPDSSWFGSPPMFLPQRQVARQFDEGSTFRPRRRLVAQRLAIELVRVLLPPTVIIALTSLLMSSMVDLDDADWSIGEIVAVFPFLYLAGALAIGAFVLALKWLVVGRYRAVEKPLWNNFVWRSELVTSTYENLAVPFFADMLRGTPFLAMYLRLLGARIGRRVFLDTTDLTEFDVVEIGDEAALNNDCGPQSHLFEDRVMKIAPVTIGARCTLGGGSIVLCGARMEPDSALGELSLLMKGETLPAGTAWEGSPAKPAVPATRGDG